MGGAPEGIQTERVPSLLQSTDMRLVQHHPEAKQTRSMSSAPFGFISFSFRVTESR